MSRRRSNPIVDAALDVASDRSADLPAVSRPRPRVDVAELRERANRIAMALSAAYEELSRLQRSIGALGIEAPEPPPMGIRTMTLTEAAKRAQAPGWASWAADGE